MKKKYVLPALEPVAPRNRFVPAAQLRKAGRHVLKESKRRAGKLHRDLCSRFEDFFVASKSLCWAGF